MVLRVRPGRRTAPELSSLLSGLPKNERALGEQVEGDGGAGEEVLMPFMATEAAAEGLVVVDVQVLDQQEGLESADAGFGPLLTRDGFSAFSACSSAASSSDSS